MQFEEEHCTAISHRCDTLPAKGLRERPRAASAPRAPPADSVDRRTKKTGHTPSWFFLEVYYCVAMWSCARLSILLNSHG